MTLQIPTHPSDICFEGVGLETAFDADIVSFWVPNQRERKQKVLPSHRALLFSRTSTFTSLNRLTATSAKMSGAPVCCLSSAPAHAKEGDLFGGIPRNARRQTAPLTQKTNKCLGTRKLGNQQGLKRIGQFGHFYAPYNQGIWCRLEVGTGQCEHQIRKLSTIKGSKLFQVQAYSKWLLSPCEFATCSPEQNRQCKFPDVPLLKLFQVPTAPLLPSLALWRYSFTSSIGTQQLVVEPVGKALVSHWPIQQWLTSSISNRTQDG